MAKAVGIDLGTTNSVIAATEDGKPTVIPNAEAIGRSTVTLPLFPAMALEDVDRVVTAVNDILREARAA